MILESNLLVQNYKGSIYIYLELKILTKTCLIVETS